MRATPSTPDTAAAVPGPRGGAVLGNLAEFTENPLGFVTSAVREHGDVVALGTGNVLLAHPGDVERVLVDRDGAFTKTSTRTLTRTRRRGFPDAMMNSDGARWRAKRDRVGHGFSRSLVATAADVTLAGAARLAADLPTGRPVDPAPAVARHALRGITRLMFGRAVDDADADAVGRLVDCVMRASTSPVALPGWLPTPANVRMRRALGEVDDVVARIAAGTSGDGPVLAALLADRPPRAELRDELATLVLSGFETTKNAVLWTCDLLARHPDHADRVAAEMTAAVSARHAGAGLLEALPSTSAVVRESLRLFPPAWLTSRESTRDEEFGGHRVPAGTTVTVSQWVTHRDPRWFPDPDGFRPARWSGTGPGAPRGAYFPFGLGPRACIGAAVALAEVVVTVADLARRFHLTLATPARPRPALSLQPDGLRLSFTARARGG
ncbi:cytochrome P450 [Saccharothrix sp. S26]|uniref:cytochrome P450 n=1 Tax=Saccharothrix sp. S26 TaxID=2907215 RepID=UPI001F2B3CD3|nr:cytochrome P450 [Saccharothrix sp. S26]MCE6997313.1 cytochrome P450 [Saccharothrix sp. S26]